MDRGERVGRDRGALWAGLLPGVRHDVRAEDRSLEKVRHSSPKQCVICSSRSFLVRCIVNMMSCASFIQLKSSWYLE